MAMAQAVFEAARINRTAVRLVRDDITDLDIEAFVFYAQTDLALGSGFGNAITVRGGPTIQKELDRLAPVETGEAVVSNAGGLKASYIVHAVGPKFQEADTETKLHTTMLSALRAAEAKGIKRIAFPAMGAGYYGIPPQVCAAVMLRALEEHLDQEAAIDEVIICVFDTPQWNAFHHALTASERREKTTR
jgi:O-acetyl-ADP-ribose deacetylase (regulator of RNase III)